MIVEGVIIAVAEAASTEKACQEEAMEAQAVNSPWRSERHYKNSRNPASIEISKKLLRVCAHMRACVPSQRELQIWVLVIRSFQLEFKLTGIQTQTQIRIQVCQIQQLSGQGHTWGRQGGIVDVQRACRVSAERSHW